MLAKDASVVQRTGLGGQMDVAGGERRNLSPAFKLGHLWEQMGEFLVGEAGLGPGAEDVSVFLTLSTVHGREDVGACHLSGVFGSRFQGSRLDLDMADPGSQHL